MPHDFAPDTIFERLEALLRRHGARFRVLEHAPANTSESVARIRGTAPGQGAKAMLCRSRQGSGPFVLAVLPGDRRIDFGKVAQALGVKRATFATAEEAVRETGCEIGGIPPFSFSPNITLVVDPILLESFDEIAFNAGRLDRSIVLDSQDYVRIAQPQLRSLCL